MNKNAIIILVVVVVIIAAVAFFMSNKSNVPTSTTVEKTGAGVGLFSVLSNFLGNKNKTETKPATNTGVGSTPKTGLNIGS